MLRLLRQMTMEGSAPRPATHDISRAAHSPPVFGRSVYPHVAVGVTFATWSGIKHWNRSSVPGSGGDHIYTCCACCADFM